MGLRLNRRNAVTARARISLSAGGGVEGTARLDRRTKRLVSRLAPGNVAVIDHEDLDRISAESLVERGVGAVVNAKASVSARYPNLGPLILATAGIPILDEVGDEIFDRLAEGQHVLLEGSALVCDGVEVASGLRLDEAEIKARMDAAQSRLSDTVTRFAENTLDYVRREQDILLDGVRLPDLRARFKGRHALVVTRGYHYKEDLNALRGYINDMRPVIVAVDGAADAVLDAGLRPDLIFGDMDSVSTHALTSGAELLVHGYPDGSAPGLRRVEALGLHTRVLQAPGTSEDVALLLAGEQGADLVVAVGSHTSMVEFLDKGRQGMASTFLVRLRLGPTLVDAKGVSQLYRTRVRQRDLLMLVFAAALTMLVVSSVSPPMKVFWVTIWELVKQVAFRISGWF
jgi:uncharacterized membrane-anchored protein